MRNYIVLFLVYWYLHVLNSMHKKKSAVVIQGLSDTGIPGSRVLFFNVKNNK
jgi:hypothetical protein